jgi:hypothetical protein
MLLSPVEQAILAILDDHPDFEVPGRILRGLLSNRGFRRSAPAFYFLMASLQEKGLVACRQEVRVVQGVEIRDRCYRRQRQDG